MAKILKSQLNKGLSEKTEKPSIWNNPNFWCALSVVISLLTASWLAFTSYRMNLSPFQPELSIGNPFLTRTEDEKKENYSMCPIIPIEFANVGARPGTVRDIVLVISAGKWKALLHAEAFSKSFGTAALTENNREVFHPFMLNAKERLFKNILFNISGQPKGWKSPAVKNGELLPFGTYTFKLYLNAGASNELRLISKKTYTLPKNIIASLATSNGQPYVPFDDSTVNARESLESDLSSS